MAFLPTILLFLAILRTSALCFGVPVACVCAVVIRVAVALSNSESSACSPVLSLSARLACASRLLFLPHSCSTGLANSLCQLFRASSSRLLRLPRSAAAACLLLVPRLATSPSDLAMPLRLATSTRHVASPTHLARLQLVQPAPSWGSVLVHALQLTRSRR